MALTKPQARAVKHLRDSGIQAGAVIDIGALWQTSTQQDKADRRCLKILAESGMFRRQGTRGLWVVRPELYEALDLYDAWRGKPPF
jgi:hypothetical protein